MFTASLRPASASDRRRRHSASETRSAADVMPITSSITFFLPRLPGSDDAGCCSHSSVLGVDAAEWCAHQAFFSSKIPRSVYLSTPLVQPNRPISLNKRVTIPILPILDKGRSFRPVSRLHSKIIPVNINTSLKTCIFPIENTQLEQRFQLANNSHG